jgi:hypothetical protein
MYIANGVWSKREQTLYAKTLLQEADMSIVTESAGICVAENKRMCAEICMDVNKHL